MVGVIALVLAAYILGTAGIYRALMSQRVAAVWDFYQLWYSARVLLERRDPYDPQVTLEMQQVLYGRSALASEGQPAFYYPLPVLLPVMPLALLPYPVAAAAWLCLLLFAVVGAVAATLWGVEWRASAMGAGGLVVWALALFPVLWSVLLGQVSVLLLALLNAGLASVIHKRDRLAGVCLAFTLLKPQLVYFILPLLCVGALINRRWRFLVALVATMITLGAMSWLLLPEWPTRFVTSLAAYATVSPFAAPLQVLLEPWLGLSASWLLIVVGTSLVVGCLALWLRTNEEPHRLAWVIGVTLVISTLVVPRIGMINQVILLWPAIVAAHRLWGRSSWGRVVAFLLLIAMAAAPWVIAMTLTVPSDIQRYQVEHQAMAPLLPVMVSLVMLALSFMPRRSQEAESESSART